MAREDAQIYMDEIERVVSIWRLPSPLILRRRSPFQSQNVLAEIPGSKYPDEVVVIGAHLDSWAMGQGANDNGCNVSMMIDIARQMKALNIQPERTITICFMEWRRTGILRIVGLYKGES